MPYLYCPVCLGEYEPQVERCKECNVDLVPKNKLIVETEEVSERLCLYRTKSEIEAISIVGALEEEGIDAKMASKQVPMYDGIFQADLGYWGDILVEKKDFEKSKKIIEEYLKDMQG